MMESSFEFKEYFNNDDKKPKPKYLHIFIVPTIVAPSTARNLPEKLEYRDPQPLLKSSGSSWDFQASDALKEILKNAIHDQFEHWEAKLIDKTTIPQYFLLAGAGEGKSRTAQELPKLLIECTNDVDLQKQLRSALVFNLSFENGTRLIRGLESNSVHAISNRMLYQLLVQPNETWDDYRNKYNVTPTEVLRRIAKHRGQKLSDLNVIIILDGLQVAMDPNDGMSRSSFFYDCISILCTLAIPGTTPDSNKEPVPFVVNCCTATISMPVHEFLASSQQKRVFLPLTSLQPPRINNCPVFKVDDPIMEMLINDMGGHGRALEALGESVRGKDLSTINYIDLINDVRIKLIGCYQGWLTKTMYLKPVLRIILSRTQVDKNQTIATFENKGIKVDDVTEVGLVRFESQSPDQVVGYLTCPYIWLWIMSHVLPDDTILREWNFHYYDEARSTAGNPSVAPGCQYWQNFEYFAAQFRALKSNIYGDNEQVELKVIHNGARHNFDNSSIYNRKLTIEKSVNRISTKSADYNQDTKIVCQDEIVDITKAEHIIINAASAKAGDSFCSIKMVGTEQLKTETHQCKLVKKGISQETFENEHKKATSLGDTFILYTSASSKNLELNRPMSAIISKDNWEEYFGPFAGRCFNCVMGPPNINEATYTQLTGMNFIGGKRAETIMEERGKRKFSDIDDCQARTKISRIYLEPFFQVTE